MAKLNLLLLVILVVCALGLVTSQNKARQLFSAVEQAQQHARALEVEYGQLQLEAATWGQHARVQRIARDVLGMHVPDPGQIRIVVPAAGTAR